ncbi:MAG TPA: hypothetical protein VF175_02895 [Lacipirellula sp.]
MIERAILESFIGTLAFTLSCSSVVPVDANIREISLSPRLPPGKSVLRCRALVFTIHSSQLIESLRLQLRCESQSQRTPCPGECLEAQEWETRSHILVVGTEDSEALMGRMPFLDLQAFEDLVEYRDDSMTLHLRRIPAGRTVSLHFIIAENRSPEPSSASAWFAVDIPHRVLLNA